MSAGRRRLRQQGSNTRLGAGNALGNERDDGRRRTRAGCGDAKDQGWPREGQPTGPERQPGRDSEADTERRTVQDPEIKTARGARHRCRWRCHQ
eukprot:scaffold302834_cov17-Prasinocladus_malaysianus.AAC.1